MAVHAAPEHDYYDSLTRFAVPLDERAIAALAFSAVALTSIAGWLSGSTASSRANLHEQFGQGYAAIHQFRAFFLKQLGEVKGVYPEARFVTDRKGMY